MSTPGTRAGPTFPSSGTSGGNAIPIRRTSTSRPCGGRTVYQTFTVHREPMLHLRDRQTDEREEMALFGSLLEHDGLYKLLSFNIDR